MLILFDALPIKTFYHVNVLVDNCDGCNELRLYCPGVSGAQVILVSSVLYCLIRVVLLARAVLVCLSAFHFPGLLPESLAIPHPTHVKASANGNIDSSRLLVFLQSYDQHFKTEVDPK